MGKIGVKWMMLAVRAVYRGDEILGIKEIQPITGIVFKK
jgi:hypothetical protein